MGILQIETFIQAPKELCFDLARSTDLHVESAEFSSEKIVAGVSTGLLKLNDTVTFEGRHFGIRQRMSTQITKFNRPYSFSDSQITGIFKSFVHDHSFIEKNEGTVMTDTITFKCPYGPIGFLVDPLIKLHIAKFMQIRVTKIKKVAESNDWERFFCLK